MQFTVNTFTPSTISGVPWSSANALSVAAGGIDIGGDTNGALATSHVATVPDTSVVTITVTKDGYYPYTMDVNVWEDALEFSVVLVPILPTGDPWVNMPLPVPKYVQRPCGGIIDIYDTSSLPGVSQFYINGELYGEGTRFVYQACVPGQLNIVQRKTTYDIIPSAGCPPASSEIRWDFYTAEAGWVSNQVAGEVEDVEFYLAQVENLNVTVEPWKTEVVLTATPQGDCDCYTEGEEVTVTPTVVVYSDATYEWRLYNTTGELVDEVLSATADAYVFTPTTLGTYRAEFSVVTYCGTEVTEVLIETCNFYDIKSLDACGQFTVTNYSSARTLTVGVTDYKNEAIDGLDPQDIGPGAQATYDLATGQFIFTFEHTTTEYQVVSNFCKLEDCMSAYISNVLCDTGACGCEYDISAELDAMRNIVLTQTYFMYLNQFHSIANFYTALEDTLMADIFSAQEVLNKIEFFCKRLGCTDTGFDCGCSVNITANGTEDCGCGCTQEKTGTKDCGCT